MGAIGIPELILVVMLASLWLVPVAAAAWLLVTVKGIRDGQRALEQKLDALAQTLRRP